MPTHGDGITATAKLAPQTCRVCAAVLVILAGAIVTPGAGLGGCEPDEVACPNGCEECV